MRALQTHIEVCVCACAYERTYARTQARPRLERVIIDIVGMTEGLFQAFFVTDLGTTSKVMMIAMEE